MNSDERMTDDELAAEAQKWDETKSNHLPAGWVDAPHAVPRRRAMKAFNPETGKADREVNFPTGPEFILWAYVCKDCGDLAGGRFSGPGLPEPSISEYVVCPGCSGKNLELVKDDDLE